MKTSKTAALLLFLFCLPAVAAARQQPTPTPQADEAEDEEVERVIVNLVSVPVSVVDREGRFVSDLGRGDFRVTDNGREQEITYFATVEQPFSVLLLMDTSGSNSVSLEQMQESAVRFVEQLRPQDRVLPVAFDNGVAPLLPDWSSDRARLSAAIRRTKTGMVVGARDVETHTDGSGKTYTVRRVNTRLYDAVLKAFAELDKVRGRKALILFTDGMDTASSAASHRRTLELAEELDALVYVVRYKGSGGGVPASPFSIGVKGILIEEAAEYLKRLADKTGGQVYKAEDLRRIADAFASIAEQLRLTYSIGYRPPEQARPGERRELKVSVKRPRVAVRARRTYVFTPR